MRNYEFRIMNYWSRHPESPTLENVQKVEYQFGILRFNRNQPIHK